MIVIVEPYPQKIFYSSRLLYKNASTRNPQTVRNILVVAEEDDEFTVTCLESLAICRAFLKLTVTKP